MKKLLKHSQSSVRLHNLRLILSTIISHEPLSRADLVRLTHISKPAVSNLVDELIQRHLVIEIGEGASNAGRKPMLLRFNSTLKYFLVFDMGREDYRVAIADLKGNILGKQSGEFTTTQDYQERLALLSTIIAELASKAHIPRESFLKIHGTASGVYTGEGKGLKWFAGQDMNEYHDIREFFTEKFHIPTLVNHSTKLSLLGEKASGKAQNFKDVVYIDFAYGLGCAFMIDGHICFGPNNSAGELGYFYSHLQEFNTARITPYEFGALERIISGKALQQKGIEAIRKYRHTLIEELADGDTRQITGKTVFNAARQGDQIAYALLKESFNYFNMALCNVINLLNPELVIFGGGFSKSEHILFEFIVPEIQDKVLVMPRLETSELKDDASIVGAVRYLIDHTDLFDEL